MISIIPNNVYSIPKTSVIPNKRTYAPKMSSGYDSVEIRNKNNISFCGYQNTLKINPYDLLKNENTAKALEDYIRNGLFIHIPDVNGKKGGDVFWDLFMGLKDKFQNCSDSDVIYSELPFQTFLCLLSVERYEACIIDHDVYVVVAPSDNVCKGSY